MRPADRRGARLYRRLLLLLPFEFRREFGAEMTDVFEAQRADARAQGGAAMLRLWLDTCAGILRTAPREQLATLRQDVTFALRSLRAAPAFSIAAILALALGIGANIAVFSVVEAILLNPLAVREPARLVSIQVVDRQNPGYTPISTDNFRDVRDQQTSFEGVAAFAFAGTRFAAEGTEPQELFAGAVSADYFDLLGVRAHAGRILGPQDDGAPGANPVTVLGYGLWAGTFGAQESIVGRTVLLNSTPFTVVGVAPPDFRGTLATFETDLFIPLSMYDTVNPGTPWFQGRRWRWLTLVARLKPGVALDEANAATALIGDQLAQQYPAENRGRSLAVLPLAQTVVNPNQHGTIATAGTVLLGVVVVVLLIACVNLANLLLARAAGRAREVALRAALGASRMRIVRQLLTESVVLGLAGGAAGLAIAHWIQQWLWSSRPPNFVRPSVELSLGGGVLLFALLVSVVAGVLFGLVPALSASRTDVVTTLKEAGRQPSSAASRRMRGGLVVAEVALSVVALTAAGIFIRSLQGAQRIDPGFDAAHLVRFNYNLRGGGYGEVDARLFHERVVETLNATPGLRAAAVTTRGPLSGGGANTITIPGQQPPPGVLGFLVQMGWTSPGYFRATGIPLVRGRDFTADDRAGRPLAGIINETMAHRFWPGDDAIGKRFTSPALPEPVEIVGVARDSKYITLGEERQPFFYLPLQQRDSGSTAGVTLLVAFEGRPEDAVPIVRAAMKSLDAAVPLTNVLTGEEVLRAALWAPRMTAALVSAFGALALVLAAVGIYGVMAYTVALGRQEIGLRMALGATPRGVLAMIVGRGLGLAGLGTAIGIAVALATAGGLASLLYGVGPRDPAAFVVAPAALVLVALVACYLPARRAASVDPAITLRG